MSKKTKKMMSMLLVVTLIAVIAVGGMLAYLTSEDSDVNVMTLGNVEIEQIEQEWNDEKTELVEFSQFKPLYPYVGEFNWENKTDADGAYRRFTMNNVVDKYVSVKNIGKSGAYVRTFIALEMGSVAEADFNMVGISNNSAFGQEFPGMHWLWTDEFVAEIEGHNYYVMVAVHDEAVKPGETTIPSLLQVYLSKDATNDDCERLDGNKNGTYDILTYSEAVQTEGFDSMTDVYSRATVKTAAVNALNTAFGDTSAATPYHPWDEPIDWPTTKPVYNGKEFETLAKAIAEANKNGGGVITVKEDASISELEAPIEIASNIMLMGKGQSITRSNGYAGTMFIVKDDATFTVEGVTIDGAGVTATGNLIETKDNSHIVLNEGAILQNNNGAVAVNLGTRIGATLTLNGGEIINNSSSSGAIWGGGHITVNSGKINNNSSTGIAGAIRMVSNCNLTMNGGEICNNTAATTGGAIYGYGASTYNFNGGKMSGNTAATGGAMYTGDGSVVNIGGTFELTNNTADEAGALRLSNRTAFNMTGGKVSGNVSKNNPEWNGFYGWNPAVNISGGNLADDITIQGGLTPTVGGGEVTGVVHFAVNTVHNTVNLAKEFKTFKFTVADNFTAFNFKPATGYTYTAGDEAKLICMNEGYETYWDAAKGVFKIQAK